MSRIRRTFCAEVPYAGRAPRVPRHQAGVCRLGGSDHSDDRSPLLRRASDVADLENEDLAYKVELWDLDGDLGQQVLAIASSVGIGHAAFEAATREFPDPLVTLRQKNSILYMSGGKRH